MSVGILVLVGVRVMVGVKVSVGVSVGVSVMAGVGVMVGVSVIVGVLAGILVFFRFSSDRRKSNNAKPKDAPTPNRIDRESTMIILIDFRLFCFIG